MSTRSSSEVGRYKKLVGDQFESWAEGQFNHAMRIGILATWHHNEPKVKIIYGQLKYDEKSVSDYSATFETTIGAPGRSGAFEAKSTGGKNFSLAKISPLQQKHLEAVARAGGIAMLLVEFRRETVPLFRRFAIPWLDIPWVTLRTAKSISADVVDRWEVAPGTCFLTSYHPGGPRSTPMPGRKYPTE